MVVFSCLHFLKRTFYRALIEYDQPPHTDFVSSVKCACSEEQGFRPPIDMERGEYLLQQPHSSRFPTAELLNMQKLLVAVNTVLGDNRASSYSSD